MTKWLVPSSLVTGMENALNRIPKDLRTWKRLYPRLKRSRVVQKRKQAAEYERMYYFYLGKIYAYCFVLDALEDRKFMDAYIKKHKIRTTMKSGQPAMDFKL